MKFDREAEKRILFWFRRDLRLEDQAGLSAALQSGAKVHCVFVFDRRILDSLPEKRDGRVDFILQCVKELDAALRARGGGLHVLHGDPVELIPQFASAIGACEVHVNRDYEPDALARDDAVRASLKGLGIGMRDYKDQVIFEKNEILTASGTPFSVFTPYRRAWLQRLDEAAWKPHVADFSALAKGEAGSIPALSDLGFLPASPQIPAGMSGASQLLEEFLPKLERYAQTRDFPALEGSSRLSVHLRFGTISIRRLVREAQRSEIWLSELIWREFFQMLLYHHPRVVSQPFRSRFERLEFPDDPVLFDAWKRGMTGYPLVDAGMRELNETGWMHNRVRMVVASFLVKDLLVDWRLGEEYFASKLLDFELASNNGNWQWAASTGCDAQPWFRIFNPVLQSKKFDPDGRYIRRHVPELADCPEPYIHAPWLMPGRRFDYPAPVVDHATARLAALDLYGKFSG
ncbi:MAG: deoxyribodipyrimidine photo-lyase [Burkholderiales bacterium]|nr:deoxyribodipyrimidine photo-lyase [Burkholderiales bacterium]